MEELRLLPYEDLGFAKLTITGAAGPSAGGGAGPGKDAGAVVAIATRLAERSAVSW
jgi:hypothetical protein